MNRLLIYGASGYTGRMVAEQSKAAGVDFVVAGRDAEKLAALGEALGVPHRCFALESPAEVHNGLSGVQVVLNCAGPFAKTAEPLMRACIANQIHYLDITAEINVYKLAERLGEAALDVKVMLMPGVGWDVVPTDSLAAHVARRVDQPKSLKIALQVAGGMSRGSAISAGEIIGAGLMARVDGALIDAPNLQSAEFDFGDGPVLCFPLSFGDLVTAWRSTGIPNITMFVHVSGDAFPQGDLSKLPDGPTVAEREAHSARAVVEITGADGSRAVSMIETVNGYSYTPLAAIEAARRVLGGEHAPGFETPAHLFGVGFAETIPGTRITDIG